MISSEVQRTLVKSPPELWTELSDPIALARHLGEFGEIRITRVEPEKLVEWQAENTTGRVSMKASGWGTKVTLSVTQEPAAEEPSTDADSEEQPASPQAGLRTEPVVEMGPAARAVESDAPLEPSTTAAEPETAGAVEEPSAEHSYAEVGPDSEPPQDAFTSSPKVPAVPDEPTQDDGATLAPPAPERRRGFFARLFGRRGPRANQAAHADSDEQPESARQASDAVDELGHSEQEPNVPPESPPAPRTAVESLRARFIIEPVSPAREAEAASTGTPQQIGEIVAVAADTSAAETESVRAEPVEADVELRAEAIEADLELPAEAVETEDVQAAVETVTAERAAAVLTGVLDRLGAAHHRPFSRA